MLPKNAGVGLKLAAISIAALFVSDLALADDEADAVELLKESFKCPESLTAVTGPHRVIQVEC
jgi:hypothetical protein